jgi:hypothetical protein
LLSLDVKIHIDVYTAQTGVSKFLEINRESGWIYNKTEALQPGSTEFLQFTHLLIEAESEEDETLKPYKSTHHIQSFIRGFGGIYLNPFKFNSPIVRLSPKIAILKKKTPNI